MTDITLFSARPSRGLTNQWLLEELGVPYTLRMLDIENNEHKSKDYRAINPMGKIPALKHGSTVVTESAAINMYLADLFPEQGLSVPVDSPLRGEYLRWCMFAPITAEPALMAKALDLTHPLYDPFADLDVVAQTLSAALESREFIVGDSFTNADVAIGSLLYWGFNLIPILPKHDPLVRYWERLSQRPAWLEANKAQ
ncbi:MAG: glutathione S-transferase family protein [Pseudomonadota bacterium]